MKGSDDNAHTNLYQKRQQVKPAQYLGEKQDTFGIRQAVAVDVRGFAQIFGDGGVQGRRPSKQIFLRKTKLPKTVETINQSYSV